MKHMAPEEEMVGPPGRGQEAQGPPRPEAQGPAEPVDDGAAGAPDGPALSGHGAEDGKHM